MLFRPGRGFSASPVVAHFVQLMFCYRWVVMSGVLCGDSLSAIIDITSTVGPVAAHIGMRSRCRQHQGRMLRYT
jgi:hypothetical protein